MDMDVLLFCHFHDFAGSNVGFRDDSTGFVAVMCSHARRYGFIFFRVVPRYRCQTSRAESLIAP